MLYLNTDILAFGMSAVFLQKDDVNLLLIAHISKALRKAKTT